MKSVLLSFVAAGAIALSTAATILPASAAAASTQGSSTRASSLSPDDVGTRLCSGDLCVQRVTAIIDSKATIKAWANNRNFTGHLEFSGPGFDANYPISNDIQWIAGVTFVLFGEVHTGGGYTIKAWARTNGYHNIGQVNFGV